MLNTHNLLMILQLKYIPEFLKTGLAKIRAHSTTLQLKAIKSVQRPIKKPISDAEQLVNGPEKHCNESKFRMTQILEN